MIVTRQHLPRRTVLRGVGATLTLPFLDSMIPALTAAGRTAARPVVRLAAIYVPNGIMMRHFTPTAEGGAFELPPILQPLAAHRERLLVLTGLSIHEADARAGEGPGDHSRGAATWLSGAHAKKTEGPDIQAGITMDQIAARALGNETQLASLELALEPNDLAGTCDSGYSCAYTSTIAWRTPTTPLPMEINPRAVFERMFGASDTTDSRARTVRMRKDRSLLDSVLGKVTDLQQALGPRDRSKLTEYLDSVRDVERRIQRAEEQSGNEVPVMARPAGVPDTFDAHVKLMFDLLVLAYQCDLTRICTFMFGREVSGRTYPEIGVRDQHHPISHHQDNPDKVAKVTKINIYHVQMLAYLLDRLQSTPDGDGSLLDHAMILYGAGMGDGDLHNHVDLGTLLAGGGAGQIKGGRHLRFPDTPLANLHVSLLDKLAIPIEHFGDSTGRLSGLSSI